MKEESKDDIFQQLQELGFRDEYIRQAIAITNDIEKATQIILKISEEGLQTDLSFQQQKTHKPINPSAKVNFNVDHSGRTKMLFVINGELKMGKGKICAQVGHAVIGAYLQMQEQAKYDERSRARLLNWNMQGTAKVVVRAETEAQMLDIKKQFQGLEIGMNMYLVEDAGHTQVKAGSKTVLGIGPAYIEEIDQITSHLKLL